jgi:hypothetical protein
MVNFAATYFLHPPASMAAQAFAHSAADREAKSERSNGGPRRERARKGARRARAGEIGFRPA